MAIINEPKPKKTLIAEGFITKKQGIPVPPKKENTNNSDSNKNTKKNG
ncbi:hypothetical protein LJC10_02085 [Selenomonadales bacterium OttesenSCG-928-I06]|nr:hypothetical protein [Selenomonadales bacterium OttesenSCG-928-I06]